MIHLKAQSEFANKYIAPEAGTSQVVHIIITKPRTTTSKIYDFVKPIHDNIKRISYNRMDVNPAPLELSQIRGSSWPRSNGTGDLFIGLNPINLQETTKFMSKLVNYNSIKRNGFYLRTHADLSKSYSLVSNQIRCTQITILILKCKDMVTYEQLKKLESNDHLLNTPYVDVHNLARLLKLIVVQSNPELARPHR